MGPGRQRGFLKVQKHSELWICPRPNLTPHQHQCQPQPPGFFAMWRDVSKVHLGGERILAVANKLGLGQTQNPTFSGRPLDDSSKGAFRK